MTSYNEFVERIAAIRGGSSHSSNVLVGTLVERQVVRVRDCQGFRADALLACQEIVRDAASRSMPVASMCRALRNDGAIDLWIEERGERWRSATFTIQLHGGFSSRDLVLVLSTYVPYGIEGDTSAYKVEKSTEYKRGTQTLRSVVTAQARRVWRESSQQRESDESADTRVAARERSVRSQATTSSSQTWRSSSGTSESEDVVISQEDGPGTFASRRSESHRHGSTSEEGEEHRSEQSTSRSHEQSESDRNQHERTARRTSSREDDVVTEITYEVSFVAVGIDYADPEALWASWSSDSKNERVATAIELVRSGVAAIGEEIEERVANRRRSARDDPSAVLGNDLTTEFWTRATKLIPVDRDGAQWPRKVLGHDGALRPIGAEDIGAALRDGRPRMLPADGSVRALFQ